MGCRCPQCSTRHRVGQEAMTSKINPNWPQAQQAKTANVRYNFAAAKTEIEELQAQIEELKRVVDTQSLAGVWRYLTDTSMLLPPGNGNVKSDSDQLSDTTQFSISRYTKGWIDGANVFRALAPGDRVYFQEEANADNSGTLQITGKTEKADHTIFDVELVNQTGSTIPKNADVVVRFTFHQPLKDQP